MIRPSATAEPLKGDSSAWGEPTEGGRSTAPNRGTPLPVDDSLPSPINEERQAMGLATTRPPLEVGLLAYRIWLAETLALTRTMAVEAGRAYHSRRLRELG